MLTPSAVLQAQANMLYISLAATNPPVTVEMDIKDIDDRIKMMYQHQINELQDQVAILFKVLEDMSKKETSVVNS